MVIKTDPRFFPQLPSFELRKPTKTKISRESAAVCFVVAKIQHSCLAATVCLFVYAFVLQKQVDMGGLQFEGSRLVRARFDGSSVSDLRSCLNLAEGRSIHF